MRFIIARTYRKICSQSLRDRLLGHFYKLAINPIDIEDCNFKLQADCIFHAVLIRYIAIQGYMAVSCIIRFAIANLVAADFL